MHDAKGRALKVGDSILIPAVVTTVHPGQEYCNLTASSTGGRKPDGAKETFCINANVVLRANPGDDTGFEVTKDDVGHEFLK